MATAISISTALPGWFAVYQDGGGEYEVPVVLWALAQTESGETYPSAFSAGGEGKRPLGEMDCVDPNFVRYVKKDGP
ncbi:hypothetical protein [Stenotrophomonas maltophilia]|uniref:hypothetical protein n=1 Tax=Stenotrophomonas maltophilia TaxID=40324 RepID=UPI0013D8E3FD|nr:hypothetical protein [Stenotrophomonas maltophilia]